jgi:hypothetical protein
LLSFALGSLPKGLEFELKQPITINHNPFTLLE